MADKKLNEAYYQTGQFWKSSKAIREFEKIKFIPENDVKSWLPKQALWQAHIPLPGEINHPHYEVTKPNE